MVLPMPVLNRAVAGLLLCASLAGCATTDMGTPGDPLERMNRGTHRFNDAVDRAVLRPVARGYRDHVPAPVRVSVNNFLENLAYPTTIVNNLLQGKVKDTFNDIGRFAVNSTIGLAGLFDPATRFGFARNDEDFGQTLGRWGVPSGPYLVLPFFGPSSMRDGPAIYVDWQTDLRVGNQVEPAVEWTLIGLSLVNRRAQFLEFDETWQRAYDPYAFIRDAWLQRREYRVRDGNVAESEPLEDPGLLEDPGPAEVAPPAGTPPVETPPPETPPANQPSAAGDSSSETSLMPASEATAGGTLQ
jgi:phospholipid-binding lipoprotein MlaA